MASGLFDPIPAASPSAGSRFRPYASQKHQVTKGRYITSNDPRGYIPVYEYPLNGQWIMMDIDDGYILWTGIWKALGNSKADIVKMIDSQPDLGSVIRRVRGGYLKIQGTWMPYEVALRLSRRVAFPIRDDLVPLFGPTFPSTCLTPDQPGYGQIVASSRSRRRPKRDSAAHLSAWTADSCTRSPDSVPAPGTVHQRDYRTPPSSTSSPRGQYSRYSPYPNPNPIPRKSSMSDSPSLDLQPERFKLPPIQPQPPQKPQTNQRSFALPPISALEDLRGVSSQDSAAVLQRLKMDDEQGAYPVGGRVSPLLVPPMPQRSRGLYDLVQPGPGSAPDEEGQRQGQGCIRGYYDKSESWRRQKPYPVSVMPRRSRSPPVQRL